MSDNFGHVVVTVDRIPEVIAALEQARRERDEARAGLREAIEVARELQAMVAALKLHRDEWRERAERLRGLVADKNPKTEGDGGDHG